MTSDHFFHVLEREADSQLLAQVGSCLAVGNVPVDQMEVCGDSGRRHFEEDGGTDDGQTGCEEG